MDPSIYQEVERPPQNAQTPASTSEVGIRGRVEVIFSEDNPAGGYEVVTKPPLGKCSTNIMISDSPTGFLFVPKS
jgi:hypothetical protein